LTPRQDRPARSSARARARNAAAFACAIVATACGTTGGPGGGGENLPNRGIVPYEVVTFIRGTQVSAWLYPPPVDPALPAVRDPSAVTTDDGVALFAHVTTAEGSGLARADASTGLDFGPFSPILAETPEDARAPAVALDPETGRWHLVVTRADGLYHGESADGRTFTLDTAPWVVPEGPEEAGGLGSASLAFDGGRVHVFYTATDATEDARSVLRHAAGRPGEPLGARRTILEAGRDCLDVQGKPQACWDAAGVFDPEVRIATTATGRRLFRLFYAGLRGEIASIGFAASEAPDRGFVRYAHNPILEDDKYGRTSPSNVRFGEAYLLYFAQPTRKPAVGVAENAAGVPSERF
jgi:hypothetical protein